ncbi:fluoride efflux transporter CrcB [Metasolibacillus meyeri]|uniref:Fluoride-specific ion channel FluC n=1 Tax=Metasolibacillus meyeri TaxID=1071052 RepID=A0AAW9NLR1_9BACL|nr:fluoride efflux transporter CrcB [Metasolibacillus meyeri]MEC1177381.1 fluoride efflux transporter CrcB [Metasolibacillus meyeri]
MIKYALEGSDFIHYLFVGLAGALGASLRYAIELLFDSAFPIATLLINLVGALLLGWLTSFLPRFPRISSTISTAITTGFLGAFTTFSAFSVENLTLLMNGQVFAALSYILVSLVGGFVCALVGLRLGVKEAGL